MPNVEARFLYFFCFTFLLLPLMTQSGCKAARESHQPGTPAAMGSTEQLIIGHLAKLYEQPKDGEWEKGKAYFLREKHGIELLDGPGTHFQRDLTKSSSVFQARSTA